MWIFHAKCLWRQAIEKLPTFVSEINDNDVDDYGDVGIGYASDQTVMEFSDLFITFRKYIFSVN